MAKDVKIRITADDRSKRGIDSAKKNLKQLGSIATSVGRSIGRVFGSIARGVRNIAIAGAAAVTAFGVASVNTARDAEEVRNKFNAVFKEIASDARQWAGDFGKSVNRAAIDVERMLSAVQDLFVPLGFSRKEASAFSKSVAQLTVDLASFNNKADDDVLRDLQSALVGNSETVRKYGIILTEANIAQEAVALGMAKTTKEVSNQAKVMARLSLIQKGSADAQGDAIRTSGSLTNILKGLSASFKTLRITVGQQLIDGLQLASNFGDLTKRVGEFTKSLKETGAIREFAKTAIQQLKPVAEIVKGLFSPDEKVRADAISDLKEMGTNIGATTLEILEAGAEKVGGKIALGILKAPLLIGRGIGAVSAEKTNRQGAQATANAVANTNRLTTGARIAAGFATAGNSEALIFITKKIVDAVKGNTEETKKLKAE